MVDITDPTVWSPLVQTVVLTATLLVFILSFRTQNLTIKEEAYQRVLDDYGDLMRMISERPELNTFQSELFSLRPLGQRRTYTREEMVVRNFVVAMYGFFERVYFLYTRKWINKETWDQWAAFLRVVSVHPVFKEVHQSTPEMWDKPFVDYVTTILDQKK